MIDCVWKPFFSLFVACGAGGISVEVLYCFGGGAARRVGIQVNYREREGRDFPSLLRRSLRIAVSPPKKFAGNKNTASYAGYFVCTFLFLIMWPE